ncbi:MAG: pyridoxamine 5'-phosphate oxidase family protein [Actinobacteria bacterium]|nr:pyridoxamine 5'-phosphate oxidase family protein [Actinomycetota bacterium]
MTNDEIKKAIWNIVGGAKVFVYTTADAQGNPHSRYMGALMIEDSVIYMATASCARKVQQIKGHPNGELLFASEEYKEVATISGESNIAESLELKKQFWQANPICKDYFSSYEAPEFTLIAFGPTTAEYLNLALQLEPFAVSLP